MPSTTLTPQTFSDDDSVGTIVWSNPGYANASDDDRAATTSSTLQTHYLKGTNPGFTLPNDAVIHGISVRVERSKLGIGGMGDAAVRIVKGGVVGDTDKSSGDAWPTADAYTEYGSSTDLWGETWHAGDINSSDFGFAISAQGTGFGASARIDHAEITVHWSAPKVSADLCVTTAHEVDVQVATTLEIDAYVCTEFEVDAEVST